MSRKSRFVGSSNKKSVHPTWHCANPNVQVTGLRVAVASTHAKLRRSGYGKRSSQAVTDR